MSMAPQQHHLVRTCERGTAAAEDEETSEQILCIYVFICISILLICLDVFNANFTFKTKLMVNYVSNL